jgi:CRP/FNR family transcriptional regulator, cyclic AMP receptor protein
VVRPGVERLLVDLPTAEADRISAILAACPTIEVEPGVPYFRNSFPAEALLVVQDGFVVVRASAPGRSRTVITCEGGPGTLVFPPSPEEVLSGLGVSRLVVVSGDAFDRLLAVPGAARIVLEHLAATLAQKQEALGNFAFTRHIDRVRRKLLQLARDYGHVARDGIRIDFPVSHTILAEMVGSSRETVTRALDELQRTGFVARRGHAYRLLVSPESVVGAVSA